MVLVQSNILKSHSFESYLNWLLFTCTKVIPSGVVVGLKDQLSPQQLKQVNRTRGVTIRAPVEFAIQKPERDGGDVRITPIGSAWQAICAFAGDHNPLLPEELRLKEVIDNGRIEASLELHWKNKRGDDDTPFLDEIATVFRNMDGAHYVINMGKYGKLTEKDFKLSQAFAVQLLDDKPVDQDVFRRMKTWLQELITSGRILGDA